LQRLIFIIIILLLLLLFTLTPFIRLLHNYITNRLMEDNCGLAADHETGVYHDEEDDGRLDDGAGERDELSEVGVIARPQKSDNPGECVSSADFLVSAPIQ
jgi:hypothetical protein